MRRVLSGVSRSVAVLAVLVGGAGRAGAGPLNPGDFTPVGPFPTAGGDIHVQHHRAESHPERDGQDDFDWRRLQMASRCSTSIRLPWAAARRSSVREPCLWRCCPGVISRSTGRSMSALPVASISTVAPAASMVPAPAPALAVSAPAAAGREGSPSSASRSPPTAQRLITTTEDEARITHLHTRN